MAAELPPSAGPDKAGDPAPLAYESKPTGEAYGAKSARGGMILTAMTLATAAINFGTQIVLAWLLTPEDFGIVAVAVSISSMVAVLRDAGGPTILIQRQHEFDKIVGSIFWLTIAAAGICGLVVAGCAPIVAHFKQTPILMPLLLLTAARFPIGALGTISVARLMVDLRWGSLAAATILQPVVTGGLAVVMAWRGWGVYSLVVPPILGDVVRGVAAWSATRIRVKLRPEWPIIVGILGSSVYILLTNLTFAARTYGNYLTLSFVRSEYETGLYYYAFLMCQALARLALATVPSVLGPVFSKVKHDQERHADLVIRSMHSYAALGVLPVVLQGLCAWPLFRLFLADKWLPAAPLFAIISLSILASFLNNVIAQALWAGGLFRQFFWYSALFMPVAIAMFIIGSVTGGATGLAWANVAMCATDMAILPILGLRWLKVPWGQTILPLWRPLVGALPAVLTAVVTFRLLPVSTIGDIARVLIVGVVGSASYFGLLWLLWRPVLTPTLNHILGALGLADRVPAR